MEEKRINASIVSGIMPLDKNITIASPSFDQGFWLERFDSLADMTLELGAKAWVFGCGKPRSIESSGKDANSKVDIFITRVSEVLNAHGLDLYIEPLGPRYSDYITTIADAVGLVQHIGTANLSVMCDMRHMIAAGDDFGNISRYADYISHAHIDYPLGSDRYFPREGDGFDYIPYMTALRGIGYNKILSIEAVRYDSFGEKCSESLRYLKKLSAI
jgi:sugar phosphate isomerase/epimerase